MPSREIIIAKREQKMTDLLGHSNIFATLSLSQLLTANYTLLNFAGVRAIIYGFSCKLARRSDCFLPIHICDHPLLMMI